MTQYDTIRLKMLSLTVGPATVVVVGVGCRQLALSLSLALSLALSVPSATKLGSHASHCLPQVHLATFDVHVGGIAEAIAG